MNSAEKIRAACHFDPRDATDKLLSSEVLILGNAHVCLKQRTVVSEAFAPRMESELFRVVNITSRGWSRSERGHNR